MSIQLARLVTGQVGYNQHFGTAHLVDETCQQEPGLHEHEVGGRVKIGEADKGEVGIEAIEGRGPKLP